FTPEPDSPAAQVTDRSTLSSFADREALIRFAAAVDVVTFEFENVPHDAVAFLAGRRPARPGPAALAVCQDRLAEKRFCAAAGIATAPFAAVAAAGDLDAALAATGLPAVLKTNRLGYDGKGQAPVRSAAEAEAAWHRL